MLASFQAVGTELELKDLLKIKESTWDSGPAHSFRILG